MKYFYLFLFFNISYAAPDWDPYHTECGPWDICRPTISYTYRFNAEADASILYNAFIQNSNATATIIDIITQRSLSERWQIIRAYKSIYGKKLDFFTSADNHLHRGNLRKLLISLLKTLENFYSGELKTAIDDFFMKYSTIIDILGTLSNRGRGAVAGKFYETYNITLAEAIERKGCFSIEFKELLKNLAEKKRPEEMTVDAGLVSRDIMALLYAEQQWKTDLREFSVLICSRSNAHLNSLNEEFRSYTGRNLETSLLRAYEKNYREGLISLAKIAQNRNKYFAERLHQSLDKFSLFIDHDTVIRIITTRVEIDLENIKEAYFETYGYSLASIIKTKTTGDYKIALLKLIKEY